MKKIEKLEDYHGGHPLCDWCAKINELVDAVNDINEQLKKHYDGYHCPKQTQEPERNESYSCPQIKEPECEHEWRPIEADTYRCYKCNKWKEKPAKKEKVSSENTSEKYSTKDELAERLRKAGEINKDGYYSWYCVSVEARKWAVEIVSSEPTYGSPTAEGVVRKILERLKESK